MKIKDELQNKKLPVSQIQLFHLLNEIKVFFNEYPFPVPGTDIYAGYTIDENYFTAVNELSVCLPRWLHTINTLSQAMHAGDVAIDANISELAQQLIKPPINEGYELAYSKEQLTNLFLALREIAPAVKAVIEFVNDRSARRFQQDDIILKYAAQINQFWQPSFLNLDSLSSEVLFTILRFLPTSELHDLKQVSERFYQTINDPAFIRAIIKQYFPYSQETNFRKILEAQWPTDKKKHLPELLFLLLMGNNALLKEKINLEDLIFPDKDKLYLLDWIHKTGNQKILNHIYKNIIIPCYHDQDKKIIRKEIGGHTLLHWAIRCRQPLERIKGLKNLGLSLDDVFFHGNGLLHEAARSGHIEVLQWLLKKSHIDVNMVNHSGYTPLLIAAFYGQVEIVQHLLAHDKIDVDVCLASGTNALDIAAARGHVGVIKLLLAHGKTNVHAIWKDSVVPLYIAAQNDQIAVVAFLLAHNNADVNARRANGATPLFIAARQGHVGVVKFLLAHNEIDVNAGCVNGATALFIAAQQGHAGVVKLLLAHRKTDVNANCVDNATALYIAAQNGHAVVVKLLLAHRNINVNAGCADGATPLYIAAQKGHKQVVRLLLIHGNTDVNAANTNGATALHGAVLTGNAKIVDYLLANKASVTAKMHVDTQDLLALAEKHHCKDKLQAWLEAQYQNPIPTKISGITSLDIAVLIMSATLVQRLLEAVIAEEDELPREAITQALKIAKVMDNQAIIKQLQKILPYELSKRNDEFSQTGASSHGFFAAAGRAEYQLSNNRVFNFLFKRQS